MPGTVLIHPETGAAEHFPSEAATGAIKAGYHVPLNDVNGNAVSVPYHEAGAYVKQGYSQPTPDQLQNLLDSTNYSTPGQKALSYIEGAAKGLAGPLAPMIETALFPTTHQDIAKRQEVNPGTSTAGEVTGLVGGMAVLPGASLPGFIAKAGAGAAKAIATEGMFGNLARYAVQGAVESSLFGLQNKMHEAVIGNPEDVAQNIASHVGMSALIGAGAGAVLGPIAKTFGEMAAKTYNEIGIPGKMSEAAAEAVDYAAASRAGLIDSFVAKNPALKDMAQDILGAKTLEGLSATLGPEYLEKLIPHVGKMVNWMKDPVGIKFGGEMAKGVLKRIVNILPEESPLIAALVKANQYTAKALAGIETGAAGIFGYEAAKNLDKKPGPTLLEEDGSPRIYDSREMVASLASSPDAMANHLIGVTEPIKDILPGLATGMTVTMAKAIGFLNDKIPPTGKAAPLDPERKPSTPEIANYNHYAAVLNNPNVIFDFVKRGTLLPQHSEAMMAVIPSVYMKMQTATLDKLTDHLAKNPVSSIPYKTRLGLSQFLGQNLDSTMSQQAILNNQLALGQIAQQKANQEAAQMRPSKVGIGKMKVSSEQTRYQQSASRGAK